MLKIDLNFLDSIDPLVKFVEHFDSVIEHGVIVCGSYAEERFVNKRLYLTLNPRDIDIFILRESGSVRPQNHMIEGVKFDVHQVEIGSIWHGIKEKRDPQLIQNLFNSALVYQKTDAPHELMNFLNNLKKTHSGAYLNPLDAKEQFLVMQNFVHKIKSKPHDIISFGKFFYPMAQTIYYFKCLKDGAWPHMHPPRVRADIKKRYHSMDKMLSDIESDGVTWVERARIIEKLVMSEMPTFL